jgi:uncharacterized phage protein gp47/JayE
MSEYTINPPNPDDIAEELEDLYRYGYKPVYKEALVFSTGTTEYDLSCDDITTMKKIYDIQSIVGTLNGTRHDFIENVDFSLYDSTSDGYFDQLTWDLGGDTPDTTTMFYVYYRYIVNPLPITDFSDGSVTKSLFVEAPSLLLYNVWLKLDEIAKNSFIDSASGQELDELGKLVGVTRNEAISSTGHITLTRPSNLTTGEISIPVGARVSTNPAPEIPAIEFETTVASTIINGATVAKVSNAIHPDYDQTWVAVQSVIPGVSNNVNANSIRRNVSANSVISIIDNPPTFDTYDEEIVGTGTKQLFILQHTADTNGLVDKDNDGLAFNITDEKTYGWLNQFASVDQVWVTVSASWGAVGNPARCTIYGNDGTYDISETLEFEASTSEYTSADFRWIYYVTFVSPTETGLGDRTVTIEPYASGVGGTDILTTWGGVGHNITRVDGGWTSLNVLDEHSHFSLADISFSAVDNSINTAGGSFTATGDLEIGDYITVSGSTQNDGTYSVLTVIASKITVNETLITDAESGTPTIVIKETTNITVHIETSASSGWVEETDGNWSRQTADVGYDTARTWLKYKTGATDWATDHGSDDYVGQKNVKFDYVPESDQYSVDENKLSLEYGFASGAYGWLDYTFNNTIQDGSDTEEDAPYKVRIKSGITAAAKGTLDAIESAVLGIDGIVGVTVDDHSTDSSIEVGHIKVFAWPASGLLSAAQRSEVESVVDVTRAAGISATVSSPTPMYFAITIDVYVSSDSGYDTAIVATACDSAISTWLALHSISQNMLKSDLIATLNAVTGVYFVDIDTLVVSGYLQVSSGSVATIPDPPYSSWTWSGGTWPDGSGNIILIPTGYIAKPDTTAPNIIEVTAAYYSE